MESKDSPLRRQQATGSEGGRYRVTGAGLKTRRYNGKNKKAASRFICEWFLLL
jgi:hypothetical protein